MSEKIRIEIAEFPDSITMAMSKCENGDILCVWNSKLKPSEMEMDNKTLIGIYSDGSKEIINL